VAHKQKIIEIIEQLTAVSKTVEGWMPKLRRRLLAVEPIMMHTMKQENTRPKGHELEELLPSSTGVHKNMKIYMMDSNIDWTKPSKRIVLSEIMTRSPSKKEIFSPSNLLLP